MILLLLVFTVFAKELTYDEIAELYPYPLPSEYLQPRIKSVDCVGNWGECNGQSCAQTYNVSVNQRGGGSNCPFADLEARTCRDTSKCMPNGGPGCCSWQPPVCDETGAVCELEEYCESQCGGTWVPDGYPPSIPTPKPTPPSTGPGCCSWDPPNCATTGAHCNMEEYCAADCGGTWVPGGVPPGPSSDFSTLREGGEALGLYMGTAVNYWHLTETPYYTTETTQYNLITAESCCKVKTTEPQQNHFEYTQCDKVIESARGAGQTVRGHCLVWGDFNPSWFTNGNFNANQLKNILENHVDNVMRHYKDEKSMISWDVVNEALGNWNDPQFYKNNQWYPALNNYVDLAFIKAGKTDSSKKLFYNDYGAEDMGKKSDRQYDMVKSMLERGIPIHGVGFQLHVTTEAAPSTADLRANMLRLGELGLDVHMTEIDVKCANGGGSCTDAKLKTQATIYARLLDVCLDTPNCKSYQSWGFTDKYTWLSSTYKPLPFDASYKAKHAYDSLLSTLNDVSIQDNF